MKIVAYAVAVLAAVGIMVAIINSSPESGPASASGTATLVSAEPMTEAGQLTLEVPGMHCEFACYPRVEKSLKNAGAVTAVTLADQPDPSALTVKQVIVRYDEGFNLKNAIETLEQDGYAASVVQ